MAWTATWGKSEKCWTCNAPTYSWRGNPRQCRVLNWWSNIECRSCGTAAPKPKNKAQPVTGSSQQESGGGRKATSYAPTTVSKPLPPWQNKTTVNDQQFREPKADKKARRKARREEGRKADAGADAEAQTAGSKEPKPATTAGSAPTDKQDTEDTDVEAETALPLDWNISLTVHSKGNTRPKNKQKELPTVEEELAKLIPESSAAADVARKQEEELAEMKQLLAGDHHKLAKEAYEKRKAELEELIKNRKPSKTDGTAAMKEHNHLVRVHQDLVLKRTERATRLAAHATKNQQRRQACKAEVEGHITRLKQALELIEEDHVEAVAEWTEHNKTIDDRSDALLQLVEAKIAAYLKQQPKQPAEGDDQTKPSAPTTVPTITQHSATAASTNNTAATAPLASAASGATIGQAQMFAQGGDPAAVAAIELFQRRIMLQPGQLTKVGTINPTPEGKGELAKLDAWHLAHEAATMLNPHQLIYTYEHMDVAPVVVQALIGDVAWNMFYGEAPVQSNTIVPAQLKQIIGHQLRLMADELIGNDEHSIREKAEKRARTQADELTKHTQDLERAARKQMAMPY